MFLTQNIKKIGGSNCKNFKKIISGNLINLRKFWDSNSGIFENSEPDPLTFGSYKKSVPLLKSFFGTYWFDILTVISETKQVGFFFVFFDKVLQKLLFSTLNILTL